MTKGTGKLAENRSSHDVSGADLVLHNGKIYTVDKQLPWVSAVAVRDGSFIAAGNWDTVSEYVNDQTIVIDLEQRFAMPGLYDMHTHPDLALAPSYAGYLDIGLENPTPEDVKNAILAYADQNPASENDPEGWVYGSYWVRFTFRQAGLVPTRAWLDTILPDRPVAILDRSWGCMLVNSKALTLAGVDATTRDPAHGYIERDDLSGEPTGILVDGAYSMIHAAMPPTPAHALQRAYREGAHFQSSRGVVSSKYVHVCEHRLEALKTIDDAGELSVRVEAAISWQDDIFPVRRRWQLLAGERHFYASNRLNANAVKFHFDGTHESRSSYLSTPWQGEKSWRGHLNMSPEHLTEMVTDLDRRGIRVIAHCTGDGASDIFLNAVSVARQRNGDGVRHQCAHSTALLDENLARFAELDVTAEFSPVGWLPSPFSNQRLVFGEERWERMYNFKGVLDAGGNAVMGTDWPVSYIDPWIGFEAMVTRKNPFSTDDQKFYGEAITLEQAMEVMTVNGARCMGIEATAGNIVVGKSADLIVLDANPFEIECRGKLHSIGVDLTFLQGQLEWDKNGLFRDSALQPTWCESLPSFVAG